MATWIRPASYPAKLYWSWRYLGLWATVLTVVAKPVDRLLALVHRGRWYQHLTERAFDRRHGVDTYRFVQLDEMDDLTAEQRREMHEYGPTRAMDFGPLVAGSGLDLSRYTFLDIGSGKGKALMLAAAFPFIAVEGVELSPALHEAAVDNLRRYRGPRRSGPIRSHVADALEHPLPDGPFVCFMFNPFPAPILRRFVDRLVTEVGDSRHVLLAHGNPDEAQQDVLEGVAALRPDVRNSDDEHYIVYHLNPELSLQPATTRTG